MDPDRVDGLEDIHHVLELFVEIWSQFWLIIIILFTIDTFSITETLRQTTPDQTSIPAYE